MNVVSSVNIFARDLAELTEFYAGLFGFPEKTELRSPIYRALDAGSLLLAFNGHEAYRLLNLADAAEASGVKSLLTFDVDGASEVERITADAAARGAKLIKPPYDTAYGSRQSVLADPEGNVFRINAF